MSFNLSRKAQSGEGEAKKPDQKKQMLLLLLIVGLFGYLYFFTDLLRPKGEEMQAEPAKPQVSAMVKQPIPKRGGGADDAAATKPAPVAPEPAKTPAVTPVKPLPPPVQAKPAPAPVAPPKAAVPAPAPKPAVAAKPAAAPVKTAIPAKASPAPAKSVAAKPTTVAEAQPAKPTGKFTLLIGEFPEGKLLTEIKSTVRKAGVKPLHVKPVKATKQMHRLVVGNYAEHDQALADVQKLKKKGVDAFLGEVGNKYVVYAGSYLYADKAAVERDRLLKLGMNASISTSEINIRLAKVSAGTYESTEKAQAGAEKLKAKGLVADVVELGK